MEVPRLILLEYRRLVEMVLSGQATQGVFAKLSLIPVTVSVNSCVSVLIAMSCSV